MMGIYKSPFLYYAKMFSYQVLIPAYNAAKTLPVLLRQLEELPQKPAGILIIDDGSTDSTSAVAAAGNARIYRFPRNQGKGRALRQGFDLLRDDQKAGFIVCLDADLQHPVSSIPVLLNEAEKLQSRFIIGVRQRSSSTMPLSRRLSNSITSRVISLLSGQMIRDSQCGFRLVAKNVLREIKLSENGFQLESEMLLRVAARKIRIDQVPIPTIYNSEGSHIHHVLDTTRFILLIFKELGRLLKWNIQSKRQK
jgi:glycosyltransferase involved in cell wall biosynthesis